MTLHPQYNFEICSHLARSSVVHIFFESNLFLSYHMLFVIVSERCFEELHPGYIIWVLSLETCNYEKKFNLLYALD